MDGNRYLICVESFFSSLLLFTVLSAVSSPKGPPSSAPLSSHPVGRDQWRQLLEEQLAADSDGTARKL